MKTAKNHNKQGQLFSLVFLVFLFSLNEQINATSPESESTEATLEKIEVIGKIENQKKEHLDEIFFETYSKDKILGKNIREEAIPDVKSALKDIPNVSVTESGAFSKQVKIRGFSGDRIVYEVDNVQLGNQGTTHTGGGELNLIDITTVESIEVIKGSPSVIFSPGATGGVVKVTTRELPSGDHFKGFLGAIYNTGYEQLSQNIGLSGGKNKFAVGITLSKTDADTYNVKNNEKLAEVILRTNVLDERLGTPDEIKDLGYNSDAASLKAAYELNKNNKISFKHDRYQAEDISFTHGASTSQVFHYDEYSRDANQLSYTLSHNDTNTTKFNLYDQEIKREIHRGISRNLTLLNSFGANIRSKYVFDKTLFRVGGEYIHDKAETNTFSEQNYYALYGNAEYTPNDKWIFTTGLRLNRWEVEQRLKPGQNDDIAGDLIGVSGKLPPQSENALTYALGGIYLLNENNNLSFNFSHTHRAPSLLERFAYDAFVGGGLELDSEKAENFEVGWKYNNDTWFSSASLFYSDFKNFIGSAQKRKIINEDALIECIRQGDCNPATGDYDDRESDFFETRILTQNFPNVKNKGFEFALNKIVDKKMEAGISFGINDFDNLASDSRPLEFKGYYKKYFPQLATSPWMKIKARYVTDEPNVDQKEGFDPFFTTAVYFGGKYKKLHWNAGISNLFNEVYHEPYGALDGLERSFNLGIKYKF